MKKGPMIIAIAIIIIAIAVIITIAVMKYEKIRKQVLDAILEAVEQGLIKGTSGNIALRDDEDDVVAITPSGIPYKGMTPEDIAIVDLNG